jgi:hypothetical protein
MELEDVCRLAVVAVKAVAQTPEQHSAAAMVEAAFDSQQSIINKLVEQQIEYGEMMDELVAKVKLLLPPQ